MEFYQVVYRRPYNFTHLHTVPFDGILQDTPERIRYRPDAVERIVAEAGVTTYQIFEEIVKRRLYNGCRILHVHRVVIYKFTKARTKPIGKGFGINGVQHFVGSERIDFHKLLVDFWRHEPAYVICEYFLR